MTFTFTNHRSIPGANYKDPQVWARPWLERGQFAEHEVAQLRWVLKQWAIKGEDPFAIPCGNFHGMAEVPLDRWDVTDAAGVPVYSVWTYMVDSGVVFHHGTAEVVGEFVQFGGQFEDAALANELEASRLEAKRADPNALLPHSFV
jgi:hypothetical protein